MACGAGGEGEEYQYYYFKGTELESSDYVTGALTATPFELKPAGLDRVRQLGLSHSTGVDLKSRRNVPALVPNVKMVLKLVESGIDLNAVCVQKSQLNTTRNTCVAQWSMVLQFMNHRSSEKPYRSSSGEPV